MAARNRTGTPRGGAGDAIVSLPLPAPLEDLASPTWLLDRKAAVIGANRAAREIEQEGRGPLPLLTPSARPILDESTDLRRALEEGRPLETWARGPGRTRRMRVFLEPLRNTDGTCTGALLVAPETTRAGRSRFLLRRILAATARELHAPIAPLATFAALAGRAAERGDAECARLYLDQLGRHLGRLEYLVGEVRELVETFTGDLALRLEPFDLAALVRQAVDDAALVSREHTFRISGPAEAVVIADRERIGRVVAALLSNAVRFSPGGGRVQVDLQNTQRYATLTFTDGGDGIPDERLAELFDGPCGDQEAPRGGLGLGLYLAREVIEQHGGTIRAERSPRRGTRVIVTLSRIRRA